MLWVDGMTYLPTCLLRRALSLAVQGLMMLSDGEMYVLDLSRTMEFRVLLLLLLRGCSLSYFSWAILFCRTWRWYSMLLRSLVDWGSLATTVALTSLSPSTLGDMFA